MVRPQTQHQNPEHMYFRVLNITYTICGENCEYAQVKVSLTLRLLMSYIYGAPILDVSRSHTTTQHSR